MAIKTNLSMENPKATRMRVYFLEDTGGIGSTAVRGESVSEIIKSLLTGGVFIREGEIWIPPGRITKAVVEEKGELG